MDTQTLRLLQYDWQLNGRLLLCNSATEVLTAVEFSAHSTLDNLFCCHEHAAWQQHRVHCCEWYPSTNHAARTRLSHQRFIVMALADSLQSPMSIPPTVVAVLALIDNCRSLLRVIDHLSLQVRLHNRISTPNKDRSQRPRFTVKVL